VKLAYVARKEHWTKSPGV